MSQRKPTPPPYLPAEWDIRVVNAISALQSGVADSEQQMLAYQWIVYEASRYGDEGYHDNDRDTAYALGRQFVGRQMVKMTSEYVRRAMRRSSDEPREQP